MSGRPLRIVQISTSERGGGAELMARKLHEAYRARGHESTLVVGGRASEDRDVVEIDNADRRRGLRLAGGRLAHELGLQDIFLPGSRRIPELVGRADVFHAHNLHGGYFDLAALPSLARHAPVVLTLHDMWLLTGHCAHSFACDRWQAGCGRCPDLTIYPAIRRDATRVNLVRRRWLIRRARAYVSAPSQWLLDRVARSHLAGRPRRLMPNGVDVSVFRPGDRAAARRELGLPVDRPIVLFPANFGLANAFRDARLLLESLDLLEGKAPLVVVFGQGEAEPRVRLLPPAASEAEMSRYYAAADVVAYPSRADNAPLVLLEALACGRPVVTTSVGGIPEIVRDGEEGLVTPPGDVRAFAHALGRLLDSTELQGRLGEAGMRRARERYDFADVATAWLDWYAELAPTRD